MVIILRINKDDFLKSKKKFIGLRWKLVSTYLLLIFLTLMLMISFINETLKVNYISNLKHDTLLQVNILADQIAPSYGNLSNENTFNYVTNLIKDRSLEMNARVLILDDNGNVVIDSHDEFNGKNMRYIEEVNSSLQGYSTSEIYFNDEIGSVLYTAVPIAYRTEIMGVVFVSGSANKIFADVNEIVNRIFLLSMAGMLITGIIAFLMADYLAKPLRNMTESVRAVSMGQHNEKIQVSGNDELSNLGNTFNMMVTKLDQVDDQRKKFVSNVSHELRTPLASMKILTESLLLQDHWDEAIYREFMGDINNEVDRLSKIVDSLLYLVDLEKKELELTIEPTYMNYLITNVVKKLDPLAKNKNINMHFKETIKAQINIDRDKIQQCLINIIGNAIKYTGEGGDVLIEMYREGNMLVIEVADTGYGIPEKDLEHIFDRFYRIDEARARKTGGSGLGLSIAQQIINLHQGKIYAKSILNQGTNMFIELPLDIEI